MVAAPLPLVVLPLVATLLRLLRSLRRRKVRNICAVEQTYTEIANPRAEKDESDDDMGFGLFD